MLHGDGNKNGIKINRSNQQKKQNKTKQKTNCMRVQHSHFFFLICKKTNLHVQHALCISLPLFCTTATLFCRTKTSNFLVPQYFLEELSYLLTQHFVSCVHASFVFNQQLQLFLCHPREWKQQKYRRKNTHFVVVVFFLSKSPGGHKISFQ